MSDDDTASKAVLSEDGGRWWRVGGQASEEQQENRKGGATRGVVSWEKSKSTLSTMSDDDNNEEERDTFDDNMENSPYVSQRKHRRGQKQQGKRSRKIQKIQKEKSIDGGVLSRDVEFTSSWRSKNSKNPTGGKASFDKNRLFNGARHILEYLSYTLFSVIIQLTFGRAFFFPDGITSDRFACDQQSDLSGSIMNEGMCNLYYSLDRGVYHLRVLAAFILGGFVKNTVLMWRKRRFEYTCLAGAVKHVLIIVGTMVPPGLARKNMERWTVLGFELAVLRARGIGDSESSRLYLEELGLLQEGEWDAMIAGDRHTNIWYWMQKTAVKIPKQNIHEEEQTFLDNGLETITTAIINLRLKASDLMSCCDLDQPSPYCSVIATLVNLNLLTLSLSKGVEWSILYYETNGSIWKMPQMYSEIFLSIAFNTIFAMLFDLCHTLYNPFGPRDGIDVPHKVVGVKLRRLAKHLSTQDDPPTFTRMSKEPSFKIESTSTEDSAPVVSIPTNSESMPPRLMKRAFAVRNVAKF